LSSNQNDIRKIYDQNKVLVYNVALNYLQNREDAEEITQDVFVQVHHSIAQFNKNSELKTWIYRITINKCLDFIKRKSSKKRLFIFGKKTDNEFELRNPLEPIFIIPLNTYLCALIIFIFVL
jgi:RNA polymerase sigma-70 factor (ECF subfamily)